METKLIKTSGILCEMRQFFNPIFPSTCMSQHMYTSLILICKF